MSTATVKAPQKMETPSSKAIALLKALELCNAARILGAVIVPTELAEKIRAQVVNALSPKFNNISWGTHTYTFTPEEKKFCLAAFSYFKKWLKSNSDEDRSDMERLDAEIIGKNYGDILEFLDLLSSNLDTTKIKTYVESKIPNRNCLSSHS